MGYSANCLSTLLLADPYLCVDVPDSWTLEEAATVPIVYSTVLYAFEIVSLADCKRLCLI